ncbi:MAG: hypothetical protein B7X51_11585, partial [Pseudomonas sp. 34-62-33]
MQVLNTRRVTVFIVIAAGLLVSLPAVAIETIRDTLPSGVQGPELVVIPAGEFLMGDTSGRGNDNERPPRLIVFDQPFAIGRYEVTFADWQKYA